METIKWEHRPGRIFLVLEFISVIHNGVLNMHKYANTLE